jgi:tRNA U34 5-methylaminomethyl-2-thiouridine-forming methyltransferase MnmC
MYRQLIITEDGSHTLFVPELDENYHSTHGAIQESQHVFIESGLLYSTKKEVTILEIGFGTGLNALLSLIAGEKAAKRIHYIGIEKYPLTPDEYANLNYGELLTDEGNERLLQLHQCAWGAAQPITELFTLQKIAGDARLLEWQNLPFFDLIYFDAFAPNKQNDLWNQELFSAIFNHANPGAIFVTYCAKGIVRRDLQAVGFEVERIPGPPGKKEMLRGFKHP